MSLTPDAAPSPNENNNWDDSETYTLSASGGGTLLSIELTMSITVGGGDGATRTDIVWVDDVEKLRETTTFNQSCSANEKVDYEVIYTRNSTGTFTVRHKVNLSGGSTAR